MAINVKEIMDSIQQTARTENDFGERKPYSTEYSSRRINVYKEQPQLVIMGAGSYGKKICSILSMEGLEDRIVCLCDNSVSRQGTKYNGWNIYSPLEAYEKFPIAMFIISPKGFEDEMIRQLVHLGVDIEKISTFILAYK